MDLDEDGKDEIVVSSWDGHVRLSPGVNFINVFNRSLYTCISRKRKKLLNLIVFLALLGSVCVKAARKTLMKSTPVVRIYSKFFNAVGRSSMLLSD